MGRRVVRLPEFVLALVGVLLTIWGLWVLYTAIVNYEPQSEWPRSLSWVGAVFLLILGVGTLALARLEYRRGNSRE
jgi:cytochrome c-type biogenesis protein CcmH/NrfF